uniref:P2X purinoreceptor 7 intracellular domain-containing protein n=1 Tax=Xiphophorus couchianus TaxID=32473 RepID=A0A3B5LWR7_9TELE
MVLSCFSKKRFSFSTSVEPEQRNELCSGSLWLTEPCSTGKLFMLRYVQESVPTALCLLQPDVGADAGPPQDQNLTPDPKRRQPGWCKCGCCTSSALPQEELCCRRSGGACIASSPPFRRLVLDRSLLQAVLLYQDPLAPPAGGAQPAALRHCAYRQFISWRFGLPPDDSHPVIPRCCVRRIREEYPSPDGRYSGFTPIRTVSVPTQNNGEL